jgi:hypothetical protein
MAGADPALTLGTSAQAGLALSDAGSEQRQHLISAQRPKTDVAPCPAGVFDPGGRVASKERRAATLVLARLPVPEAFSSPSDVSAPMLQETSMTLPTTQSPHQKADDREANRADGH